MVATIQNARAIYTGSLYGFKWQVFEGWCDGRGLTSYWGLVADILNGTLPRDASAEVRYECSSHWWISPFNVSENRGYDRNLLFRIHVLGIIYLVNALKN